MTTQNTKLNITLISLISFVYHFNLMYIPRPSRCYSNWTILFVL